MGLFVGTTATLNSFGILYAVQQCAVSVIGRFFCIAHFICYLSDSGRYFFSASLSLTNAATASRSFNLHGALAASRSDVGINSRKNRSDVSVRTRKDPYVHPKYSR